MSTILVACASIPGEAPELSAQLGSRINAMESAHQRLLQDYFKAKRHQVDEFIKINTKRTELMQPLDALESYKIVHNAEQFGGVIVTLLTKLA